MSNSADNGNESILKKSICQVAQFAPQVDRGRSIAVVAAAVECDDRG